MEKDISHRIMVERIEEELGLPKNLIKYIFFKTLENLKMIGDCSASITEWIEGKSESETIQSIIGILNR
jgi:hypothetical protein